MQILQKAFSDKTRTYSSEMKRPQYFYSALENTINCKRDRYTIFEFDFGMDSDEHCLCRGRRSLTKINNVRRCPEPMRKENLYTVSLFTHRGFVEMIVLFNTYFLFRFRNTCFRIYAKVASSPSSLSIVNNSSSRDLVSGCKR